MSPLSPPNRYQSGARRSSNEVKLGVDALPVPMEAQSRRMVKLFAFKLAIFQIASRVFLKQDRKWLLWIGLYKR
jgi:hypothetical protein